MAFGRNKKKADGLPELPPPPPPPVNGYTPSLISQAGKQRNGGRKSLIASTSSAPALNSPRSLTGM